MNYLAISLRQVQRSEGKIKYLHSKQGLARTCKDYVIGREKTTELKIAMDNVSLGLCDYFATSSPLLIAHEN